MHRLLCPHHAQVEFYGATTQGCGGGPYAVVRMVTTVQLRTTTTIDGVERVETKRQARDGIGFVPAADLNFCANPACGACGAAMGHGWPARRPLRRPALTGLSHALPY